MWSYSAGFLVKLGNLLPSSFLFCGGQQWCSSVESDVVTSLRYSKCSWFRYIVCSILVFAL